MSQSDSAALAKLLASFDRALKGDPGLVDAYAGRGMVLRRMGRRVEALASLDRAIALRPDSFEAVATRAIVLGEMRRGEAALAGFEAAIALRPGEAASHANRARVLRHLNRLEDAYAAFDRATALNGDLAAAWYGKGMIRLLQGRYREGWPLHEWRWRLPGFAEKPRDYSWPRWDGTPFPGRTLFIHAEQGFGDAIQFHRFVSRAAGLGHTAPGPSGRDAPGQVMPEAPEPVVLEAPAPLATLFSEQPDAPIVVRRGQGASFDLWCPMMSLPLLLGTELSTLPTAPYLRANAGRVRVWTARLSHAARPRIGIVWAGSPYHANDRDRSMGPATMLGMIGPGPAIVSLQRDATEEDRAVLRGDARVVDPTAFLTDFAETAAAIETLDLIISVDTAVAHLAGALGKPVWILLPTVPDWRWLLDRSDSPWYPSARLFRQTVPGDWSGVADQVRAALQGRFESA